MNKNLAVALALVTGLLGGLLTRYITPPSAFAQDQARVTKEIRAQSFTLVDPSDRMVGTFTIDRMRIVLRDSNGREMWSAGGSPIRPASEK